MTIITSVAAVVTDLVQEAVRPIPERRHSITVCETPLKSPTHKVLPPGDCCHVLPTVVSMYYYFTSPSSLITAIYVIWSAAPYIIITGFFTMLTAWLWDLSVKLIDARALVTSCSVLRELWLSMFLTNFAVSGMTRWRSAACYFNCCPLVWILYYYTSILSWPPLVFQLRWTWRPGLCRCSLTVDIV